MKMHRRGFLAALATAAAGATFDPDRLLWVPGAKTWFLPSPNLGSRVIVLKHFVWTPPQQMNISAELYETIGQHRLNGVRAQRDFTATVQFT